MPLSFWDNCEVIVGDILPFTTSPYNNGSRSCPVLVRAIFQSRRIRSPHDSYGNLVCGITGRHILRSLALRTLPILCPETLHTVARHDGSRYQLCYRAAPVSANNLL